MAALRLEAPTTATSIPSVHTPTLSATTSEALRPQPARRAPLLRPPHRCSLSRLTGRARCSFFQRRAYRLSYTPRHSRARPPASSATDRDSSAPSPDSLRTLAAITDDAVQRRWHSALDRMEAAPGADVESLRRIRSWISHGITIDLESSPARQIFDNTPAVYEHADDVRTRIREYIAFEAVVRLPADHPCPLAFSLCTSSSSAEEAEAGDRPLPQPQRQPRVPVLLVLVRPHSRRPVDATLLVQQVGPVQLLLIFPLHSSGLPYFIFQFEGELYQFTRMPFGLSSAPRICTMLLSVLQDELHHCGISRLVRYLDDFLPIEADFDSAQRSLATAQRVMSDFGLVVNRDKTEGPSQRITFLGILLDSTQQTLACTEERLAEISSLLSSALQAPSIRLARCSDSSANSSSPPPSCPELDRSYGESSTYGTTDWPR